MADAKVNLRRPVLGSHQVYMNDCYCSEVKVWVFKRLYIVATQYCAPDCRDTIKTGVSMTCRTSNKGNVIPRNRHTITD